MRTVIRREKNRRHKTGYSILPRRGYTPAVFDELEQLNQQLNFTLPECIISQMLISTDCFLAYAWRRYLFSGKRSAVFLSLESARHRLEDATLSRLIIDMESLTTSRFTALETVRQLAQSHPDLHIYLLADGNSPAQLSFMRASGPFHVLARALPIALLRQALMTPSELSAASLLFQRCEWQIICALAQGQSLKSAAQRLNLPYHQLIYRVTSIVRRLGLPDRQSFTHLLHQLTIATNH